MIQIWKETLLPGTMLDRRSKKKFTITDADIKAARQNLGRMCAKGRTVPLVYEHQDVEEADAEEWKANYARNTFGRVGGARVSEAKDVAAGIASRPGTLLVRHDVYTAEDEKAVRRAGYVSPKIYRGYLDSQGEEYTGVTVAHIAASPTVCQFWQKPFEMSDTDALYLSYDPPEGEDECPLYADTFSEWLSAVELSMTADPAEETAVADEETPPPKKKDDEGGGGKGKKTLTDVIKALKDTGMNIPDEVEDECGLIIAIKASKGGEIPPPPPEEEAPPPNPDADTTSPGGPPMVMSTLDRDPKRKTAAEREAKPEREDAAKRIKALLDTGRIDPVKSRALNRVALGTEMSFTADGAAGGKRWVAHLSELAELEKKPEFSAWKPKGQKRADGTYEMSATDAASPPDFKGTQQVSDARGQVGAEFILGKRDYKDT